MRIKLSIIIGFLLITNLEINAQIEYGIKAGPNLSKYIGDLLLDDEYNYRFGFYVGGFTNFNINEKFKIQAELLFAQQGTNLVTKDVEIIESQDKSPIFGDFKTKIVESTLLIPVLAQFYVNENIYLEAGPQFGYIVNRDEEITESPTGDPIFNNEADFDYDKFDFGFSIGSGYELNDKVTINLRYYFGLIERDFSEYKSSVFNLGVEYRL